MNKDSARLVAIIRTLSPRERLDFYSIPEPNSGCLLWLGPVIVGGYGRIKVHGEVVLAHRLSYQLSCGPIPDGLEVCHRCDMPGCIEPGHLFLGSHKENMADMSAKRRNPKPRGADHWWAKLTAEKAEEIRAAKGRQKDIAARFGVSQQLVSNVRSGRAWV